MKTCSRCRAENRDDARQCASCGSPMQSSGTMVENPAPPVQRPVPPSGPPGQRHTILESPAEASRPVPPASVSSASRKTQFMAPPASSAETSPLPRADDRKIVAVLVTYSWKPGGQLFAIREGRNIIGRGSDCDVSIPEDNTLSEKHAHITYRKSFVIGDLVSMSGTFVNNEPIEEQFVALQNYAEIRTGSTVWKFAVLTG